MLLAPGTLIGGKYLVERVLGEGAMGVVVAARHVVLHETRAIKVMRPSFLSDAEAVERFLREARAAVRLKSQHVCKAVDVGRLDDGAPFIVMEHLEGRDLKAIFESRGRLPVSEAVTCALHALDALAEAHAMGIIHRDIKPANLFLTTGARGEPLLKVLDFGIAKVSPSRGSPDALEMTGAAEIIGTPVFMSPEQMRVTRDVDGRADLWAVGVVLYRALTGHLPFSGSTITQVCAAVVADPPAPLSAHRADIAPLLEAIVLRCLEKDPEDRFATAGELMRALAPFASLRESVAPPEIALPEVAPASMDGSTSKHAALTARPSSPAQSSRALFAAGVMAVLTLMLGLALIVRALGRAPPAAHAAAPSASAITASAEIAEAAPTAETPAASASASNIVPPPPPGPSASAAVKPPSRPRPRPVDAYGDQRK